MFLQNDKMYCVSIYIKRLRQIAAFEQLGIPKEHIYLDKMSGKNFDRPAYRKLLRKLKKGSILYLKNKIVKEKTKKWKWIL